VIAYEPAGVGAVVTTVQAKLRETVSVKDFGAVGDGVTDDTAAIQAALDSSATVVNGVQGETYRITSTLNMNGNYFDGNQCTILKDFAGVGISITGGPVYTYIKNFTIIASASHQASDYDGSATEHGIDFSNTRVEAWDVFSNGHKGAGFYSYHDGGNMNKCKFIRIAAGSNALAGAYFDAPAVNPDNMSVWEFNGRFQSNYGHGILITDDCPARSWDVWLYCEDNFRGASASALLGDGGAQLNGIIFSRIWAYVEEQTVGFRELVLGTVASSNLVQSVRANDDNDLGSGNTWFWSGGRFTRPTRSRQVTISGFLGLFARVAEPNEYCRVPIAGNGGNFGYVQGIGGASGQRQIQLLSDNETSFLGIGNDRLQTNVNLELYGQGSNRQIVNFVEVAPVGNQIQIVVTVGDRVAKQGTGLLDIYLTANTDSNTSRFYHKAFLAFSARESISSSNWDSAETVQASAGFTLNSVTVSGLQATILYDLNAAIIGVSGYVLCHGAMGFMTNAVLEAP
jgi:hypothetical protein